MKEGSLFGLCLFVLMGSTKLECFRSCSWSLWKSSRGGGGGVHGLGSMTFGLVAQKFLNIE